MALGWRPPPAGAFEQLPSSLVQAADEGFGPQGIQVPHLVKVNPGGEGPVSGATQDDSPDLLVIAALAEPLVQVAKHGGAQQVQVSPALNAEGDDGVLLFQGYAAGHIDLRGETGGQSPSYRRPLPRPPLPVSKPPPSRSR